MSIGIGDITEAKRLRKFYNQLLLEKDLFVEGAMKKPMNAEQRAEAELHLIELTGDLKRLDVGIHLMLFGGDAPLELQCKSLSQQANEKVFDQTISLRKTIHSQREEITELKAKIGALRTQNYTSSYKVTLLKKKLQHES